MAIKFYSTKNAYGEISNFTSFRIVLDRVQWPTSEYYFQAQKFDDEAYREKIRTTKSPMIAARLGRSRKLPIRPDWEAVEVDVMRKAVAAKINANEELIELLLSTGDDELIEDAARDCFWGCGDDGSGKNWLGRILMDVRRRLRNKSGGRSDG